MHSEYRRRGLALAPLRAGGVEFMHGDVRSPGDLAQAAYRTQLEPILTS